MPLAAPVTTATRPSNCSIGVSPRDQDPPGIMPGSVKHMQYAIGVTWLVGDATTLPPPRVDLVTMTGNVAQVFLTDQDWSSTLRAARSALRPGGALVFEVRDPAREAWREWTRERSHRRVDVPGVGAVETWVDLTDVRPPLVSFRWTFVFEADGAVLTSDSTLRFRSRGEVGSSLRAAGFVLDEVRDAPDRPGRELVFVARRSETSPG
jgi:hypothetical protein